VRGREEEGRRARREWGQMETRRGKGKDVKIF
jgi:hypothetical protein